MRIQFLIIAWVFFHSAGFIQGQQNPDLSFQPVIPHPAYNQGKGPHVVMDEAHHNFHTSGGRYKPFAEFLRRDGYRVNGVRNPITTETLKTVDVFVIANPLHEQNATVWSLPTPSAYTKEEIKALHDWVDQGGSLFLIVDHFPFPGAANELAKAFGIEFSNGWATPPNRDRPASILYKTGSGLKESAITRGRKNEERITEVMTFTGSAFKAPPSAVPVLVFASGCISLETRKAREFTPETPKVPIEGWYQGALLKQGRGRVAVFGEAAMFSAQKAGPAQDKLMGMNAPEAKQNHQFLLNIMHWLSRAPGMPD